MHRIYPRKREPDEEGMSSAADKTIWAMPGDYVIKSFLVAYRTSRLSN